MSDTTTDDDSGGSHLDLAAAIGISVGKSIADDNDKRALRAISKLVEWTNAGISNSVSVATLIDMGGPVPGQVWDVRMISVAPDNPFGASLAWPVTIYVVSTNVGNPQPADAEDFAQQIPVSFHYSRTQLVVHEPSHLWVGVLAANLNQRITVKARRDNVTLRDFERKEY